jgi:hypothetical protein
VVTTLAGHAQQVTTCRVAPNGRVVSGSRDCTLKIWDVERGDVISTLKGHTGGVTACAVSASGRRVYSSSFDTTIRIWDLDTGRLVTTIAGHAGPVTCLALTPDDRRLLSAAVDQALKLWDLEAPGAGASAPPPRGAVRTTERRAAGARHTILFLAANAKQASRLDLDAECAAIESELQLARFGNDFDFRSKWAVSVDAMARHLFELQPTIIHFSGHGRRDSVEGTPHGARDVRSPGDAGIYLMHDEQPDAQLVTGHALALMIKTAAPRARVVVLNACYSDHHAETLCETVDCVVGMTREIQDRGARTFAKAFYRALGNRRSVGSAVEHARASLAAINPPDESVPRCRSLHWSDPNEIYL